MSESRYFFKQKHVNKRCLYTDIYLYYLRVLFGSAVSSFNLGIKLEFWVHSLTFFFFLSVFNFLYRNFGVFRPFKIQSDFRKAAAVFRELIHLNPSTSLLGALNISGRDVVIMFKKEIFFFFFRDSSLRDPFYSQPQTEEPRPPRTQNSSPISPWGSSWSE